MSNIKYVYVLVSNEDDYYFEQCIISIFSLKKRNIDANVYVLTDNKTNKTLVGKRKIIREYAKVIPYDFDEKISNKERSRILKTSLRRLIDGKLLYIDVDTVIADRLDEIGDLCCDIAMVLDNHEVINKNYYSPFLCMNAKKMHFRSSYKEKHFNSGVIFINDTQVAYDFFKLWNKLYRSCAKNGLYSDQTSLNEANARMHGVVTELDGCWNTQIRCGVRYLAESRVLHYSGYMSSSKQSKYLNTIPFELCEREIFEGVKKEGKITDEVVRIISNPKRAFKTSYILSDDCVAYSLIFSNHFRILKFIKVKLKRLFGVFEKLYGVVFKLIFGRV